MKWDARPYQDRIVRFMLKNPAAAIFVDMGLGKTASTLAAFSVLKAKRVVNRMLVLAPLRVALSVWKEEVEKWDDFAHLRISIACGVDARRRREALEADADIYIVNYDNVPWLCSQDWKWPEMLVADESSRLKSSTTKRFKALRPNLGDFRRRYALTGTPAPNGLIDLFGQMYVVDLGDSLGPFVTHYRNRYFRQTGYQGYTWVPREGAEDEVYHRISKRALRMSADEFLQLPPVHHVRSPVALPKKARDVYKKVEEELFAELESGKITAWNAGAKTTKLRQIANGRVYLDGGGVQEVHSAKREALVEIIDELQGQPALVVYAFQHDRDSIVEALDCPVLGGGTTTKEQAKILKAWNRRELRAVAVHPQSAGHGLNLQAGGSHVIWYGFTWDLEHYEQTIARLRRPGQEADRVVVHHLVAEDTVDELVLKALGEKAATQRELFDALRKLRRR